MTTGLRDVHVQGKSRALVSVGRRLLQVTQVSAGTANPQLPTLRGEDFQDFVQGFPGALHDQRQSVRIEIPHTVVVRYTGLGTHPHRGRYALTVTYRAQAA